MEDEQQLELIEECQVLVGSFVLHVLDMTVTVRIL